MRPFRYIILMILCLMVWEFTPIYAQEATPVSYGERTVVMLSDDTPEYAFTFEGAEGDTIYISAFMADGQAQSELALLGVNGTFLSGVSANAIGSVLGPYTLPASGTYAFALTRPQWNAGSSATFEVVVDVVTLTSVKPDGVYDGKLETAGSLAFFTYSGTQGELFGYAAIGDNVLVSMLLPGGTPFTIAAGDTLAGQPLNVLPEDGTYVVLLQTASPTGTDYVLRLNPIATIALDAGIPATGSFTETDARIFEFDSEAGAAWSIDIAYDTPTNDTWVEIYRAGNAVSPVAADYGSGPNSAPRIDTFIAPENATYYVLLQANNFDLGEQSYDFTLTLSATDVAVITPGEQVAGTVSDETGSVFLNYNGTVDERIRVTLDVTSTEGMPSLRILGPSDEVARYFARSSQTTVTFEVVLPETGLYRFEFINVDYNPTTLDFAVMVEQVE